MNKPKLKIAFQMDSILEINVASDTTFALILEAYSRNFDLYYYNPASLTLNGKDVLATAQKILKASSNVDNHVDLQEEKILNLNEMNVIWLRQDPPFDMSYLTSAYLLEYLIANNPKVLVLNNPKKVLNYPEKIVAHYFSHLMPKTIITKNRSIIKDFLIQEEKVIIKPLYDAKGNSVFLLENNTPNVEPLIDNFLTTYKEPIIVQEFLKNIVLGDKRVLIIDGEPLGAFTRVPQTGITSNLAKGGRAEEALLSNKELQMCKEVGAFLKHHDLFFAGIDIIDEKLTEINLTSPTGVVTYYNISGVNLAINIWDKVLLKLETFAPDFK